MPSMNGSTAKAKFERICDSVRKSRVPARLRRRGGDVVLVAAEDWDAVDETLKILAIPGAFSRIREGKDYRALKTVSRPALERLLKS